MNQIKNEYVIRIPSHYVGEDCLQIMIPHGINETTTILNARDITYHYMENSPRFDNQYLTDERRHQFPYSSVPTHIDRGKFRKLECVNQLLDFNQVYLQIIGGLIIERYAIKDGDEALLAFKFIIPSLMDVKYMSREEINELINSSKEVFDLDGSLRLNFALPTEDTLLEWYRKWLIDSKQKEKEERQKHERWEYGHINTNQNELDDYFYRSLDKLTVSDLPTNTPIIKDLGLINTNNHEFESVQTINIIHISHDKYKVEFYNYPITKYTLEHLKNIETLNGRKSGEPKFPRMLNPQIDRQEIKKSKQLVKKKTK